MTTPDKATMAEIEARDALEVFASDSTLIRDLCRYFHTANQGMEVRIERAAELADAAIAALSRPAPTPTPTPTREGNINLVENLFLDIPILDWPCEAQFKIATRIAANVGYVLAPEPLLDRPASAAEVTGERTAIIAQLNEIIEFALANAHADRDPHVAATWHAHARHCGNARDMILAAPSPRCRAGAGGVAVSAEEMDA